MLEVSLSFITFAHLIFYIMLLSFLLAFAFILLFSHSAVNIVAVFILSASTFVVLILSSIIIYLFSILFFIFALMLAFTIIYLHEKLHSQSFLVYVILT